MRRPVVSAEPVVSIAPAGRVGVSVRVSRLTKSYGSFAALGTGLDLDVPAGTFATLLGPSGSGKTTTLRCVAGLERPDSGEISIGDNVVFQGGGVFVPPQRRGLGMVFQSFAVWPHMTVADNVAYPLRIRSGHGVGGNRADIEAAVTRTLAMVGLGAHAGRYPGQLSGGQQQRVALARALVGNPPLILFDEPLSNLDAQLREQMRAELRQLHGELGVTAIYVTHDQAEAMELSDVVFLMNKGQIIQSGSPLEVYDHPADPFACQLMGAANVLEVDGAVADSAGVSVALKDGFSLRALTGKGSGRPSYAAIRPHRLMIGGSEKLPGVAGTIEDVAYLGERVRYSVRCGTALLRIDSLGSPGAAVGETVTVRVAPQDVMLM